MKEFKISFPGSNAGATSVLADSVRAFEGAYHFYTDGKLSAMYPISGCAIHRILNIPGVPVMHDDVMEVWVSIKTCSGADEPCGFPERATAIAFSEAEILQATIDNEIAGHSHMVEDFDVEILNPEKIWKHDDFLDMEYGLIKLEVFQKHRTDPEHPDHGIYPSEYTFFKKLVPKPKF